MIRTTISTGGPISGPEHYQEAERILAEIKATPSPSNETETSRALCAQAHATLALATATAIDPARQHEEWREVAGARRQPPALTGPTAASGQQHGWREGPITAVARVAFAVVMLWQG